MKAIIFLIVIVFAVTNCLQAQNKRITVYYNGDSTEVVNIANTDSVVIFICGVSKVEYENKLYNTVLIGEQCWLKENLDVGNMITGSTNQTNNSIIEKYCFNNEPDSCSIYGGLYQWNEAIQYVTTPGAKGICPPGWHIPTYEEFDILSTTVGGDGNSLKAVGQGIGGGEGTNTSGFSALLAGFRSYVGGIFGNLSYDTFFWSSTESGATYAYYLRVVYYSSYIELLDFNKDYGFSVRCLKD